MEYIYGIHPVTEALKAGRRRVRCAWLASSDSGGRLRQVRALLGQRAIPVETADRERLQRRCQSAEHQGVVLETDAYPYADSDALEALNRIVLLDNVEDPQNVGAVLRSALFFGWRGILLSVRGVPGVYPSVVKASAGASEHLLICRDRSANRWLQWLRERAFTVGVLDAAGPDALDRVAVAAPARLALVLGGEHRGVGQYIRMHADYRLGIPGQGPVDSLNASVAAGIALSRLAK